MSGTMMKCGCAAQGYKTATKGQKHDPIPACLVHDCVEPAETEPDFSGRTAYCSYGKHAQMPSSADLAFFEYRGPGSREATEKCKCGHYEKAHGPRWRATIKVIRRWFKHERYEDLYSREDHWPDEETALLWAEGLAENFRRMRREETKVFMAEIVKLEQVPKRHDSRVCRDFTPQGPQEHDRYYCGCHGWD